MAGGYSLIGGVSAPEHHKHGLLHGVLGLVSNLGTDIKETAVGLPHGLVETVRHPIRTGEAVGKTTWQTWSPLFQGHVGTFLKQTYDHPLAPLLDTLTVFSLGVGTAARAADVAGAAGRADALGKLARLRAPKEITLHDPKGLRPDLTKPLSRAPSHRLLQETVRAVEPHMPQWFAGGLQKSRYERAHMTDVAHRVLAKNVLVTSALKAGRALDTPRARQEITAGLYLNLVRHGHRMTDRDAAKALGSGHYGVVLDARKLDPTMRREHRKSSDRLARLHNLREKHAEAAHSLASLSEQLEHQNAELARMRTEGHIVATPAETKLPEPTTRQQIENAAKPLVELQSNIKRLTKQHESARVSKKIHDRVTREISDLTAQRMDYEQRSFTDYFRRAGESHESFEDFVENLGSRVVRGGAHNIAAKLENAARDSEGRVIVVPLHDAANLGLEAKNSSRLLRWLYQNPTKLWKMLLLGYTPRVVLNNGVGNWFLYAIREQNPAIAIRAVYDSIAAVHGAKVASSSLKRAVPFKRNHWIYRYFGDEIGDTFGGNEVGINEEVTSRLRKGFYPIVHKFADEPVRAAAIVSALRRAPEVKALMDQGYSFDRAAHRAVRHDPALRQRIKAYARTIAGDYTTLNPVEKRVREIIPFYLWDRHILKTTGHLFAEQPGRLTVAAAIGQVGADKTREQLGDIPEFMLNMIPLPGHEGDRKPALGTIGLNPFSTIPELYHAGQALTTGGDVQVGESVGAQVNPLIAGLIEQVSGHRLTTDGSPPRHGGVIPSVLTQTAESIPLVAILERAANVNQYHPKTPPLYAHSTDELIASLAGIPVKKVNLERAHEVAAEEKHIKRKRKKKTAYSVVAA